jgi:hypothetical protein
VENEIKFKPSTNRLEKLLLILKLEVLEGGYLLFQNIYKSPDFPDLVDLKGLDIISSGEIKADPSSWNDPGIYSDRVYLSTHQTNKPFLEFYPNPEYVKNRILESLKLMGECEEFNEYRLEIEQISKRNTFELTNEYIFRFLFGDKNKTLNSNDSFFSYKLIHDYIKNTYDFRVIMSYPIDKIQEVIPTEKLNSERSFSKALKLEIMPDEIKLTNVIDNIDSFPTSPDYLLKIINDKIYNLLKSKLLKSNIRVDEVKPNLYEVVQVLVEENVKYQ